MKKIEIALKHLLVRFLSCLFRQKPGTFDAAAVDSILIVRQDNRIGNQIFILPLAQMLRKKYPCARIGLVVGGRYPDLLSQSGLFDRVHCYDQLLFIRNPWRFLLFVKEVRGMRYGAVLDAKRVFSFNNFLLTLLSGAPVKIGFAHAEASGCYTCEVKTGNAVLYEADHLGRLFDCFEPGRPVPETQLTVSPGLVDAARSLLSSKGLLAGDCLIGVHPGGRGGKRWPPENFAEVCGLLLAQTRACIALFLGPEEKGLVFRENDRLKVLRPAHALDLCALLKCCSLLLCNDSGALHLAAALNVPTLSLFLASSPLRYAPKTGIHTVLDGTSGRPFTPREVHAALLKKLNEAG